MTDNVYLNCGFPKDKPKGRERIALVSVGRKDATRMLYHEKQGNEFIDKTKRME